MRRTPAAPADHLPPRLLLRERPEIPIRQEHDLPILRDRRHHRRRIRRRTADIRHRLHRRRRIHIRHEHRIGMRRTRAPHLIRQRIREHPARRIRRRQQRHLLRRKNIRRLRHEPHPAEHDHLRIRPRRLPRQTERIPREIRDLLDLLRLIKMRQNHRLPLPLQTLDLLYDIFHTALPRYAVHTRRAIKGAAVKTADNTHSIRPAGEKRNKKAAHAQDMHSQTKPPAPTPFPRHSAPALMRKLPSRRASSVRPGIRLRKH